MNFLIFIDDTLNNDIFNAPNIFRLSTLSLKKTNLKLLRQNILTKCRIGQYKQWYQIIVDIMETQLYKPIPPKVKRKPPKYRLKCLFTNKAFDFINLPKLLRAKSTLRLKPDEVLNDEIPMVVFKLVEPIRSTIMNYSKFVSSLDIDQAFNDIGSVPCSCHEFDNKFVDDPHQHILTGNLEIIEHVKLRNLIRKGPKYREPEKVDFTSVWDQIDSCLDMYIEQIAKPKKLEIDRFRDWKTEVLRLVSSKIADVSQRFVERDIDKVLDNTVVKASLRNLHSKFVFCPIDKAGNNVAIICKRLYAQVILKELNLASIDSGEDSNTYTRVLDRQEQEIVEIHRDFQAKFSLEVEEEQEKLPPMHWTPKMHKTPIGARFIIGSKMSSLKPIGKTVTKIFKVLFHYKRRYCRKAGHFSGLNYFWCIDGHDEVVNILNRLNSKKHAKTINTYDFSTLYTKIPHDKLVRVLSSIVDSVFNDTTRIFMCVGNSNAYWVKGNSSKYMFTGNEVKACFSFLIQNAFFRVGKAIFRQIIGIPIGSDPAPFFANLFLFHYESEWVKSMSRIDFVRARRLFNCRRFIDDLIALNDNDEFLEACKEIYPDELVVNKENVGNSSASYLNLWVSIGGDLYDYKLFDKRDDFAFDIVRFPYSSSNIPTKMFYSTIVAEILRICRSSAEYISFLDSCDPFLKRMTRQGAVKAKVRMALDKLLRRHFVSFAKFGLAKEPLVNHLIGFM